MDASSSKKNTRPALNESQVVKKRHRVAVVCINCRKKKIKCDKKKPECGNCVKLKNKCQYQDLVWASSTLVDDEGRVSSFHDYSGQNTFALTDNGMQPFTAKSLTVSDDTNLYRAKSSQQKQLKETKTTADDEIPEDHPKIDPKETMDFFEGTICTEEIARSGPFSWLIFASKDRFIRFLWLKAAQPKQRQHLYLNANLQDGTASGLIHSQDQSIKLANIKAKVIVPSFQPIPTEKIKEIILQNLPTRRALWILVWRFHEYIYPYLAYVCWDEFLSTIKKCLNTHENDKRYEKFTSIQIDDKIVLCHFAILFVMLRVGYLSLSEEVNDKSEKRKYILNNPIMADSISSAQMLLNQFNVFDKPPLELLEGFIYMRWYYHYSPEQGDNTGIADSTVFNSIIVSLAITLGLNRDPGNLEKYRNDIRHCNLRRRLWHFVAMFDLYNMVSLGRPTAYITENSSVKFPELIGQDDSEENIITKSFTDYFSGYDKVSKLATILMDGHCVNIYELIKGINNIDKLKNQEYSSLSDILNQNSDLHGPPSKRLRRVIQLIRYVYLNTVCFTTEYNIFLHFENSDTADEKLARYYLSKIVSRSNEMMTALPPLMTSSSDYIGYGLDIIQFPATLLSLHKALQVQTSLSLRCQHLIKLIQLKNTNLTEKDKNIQKYLRLIAVSIAIKIEDYLKHLNNACKKYQYAWRLKRPHTLFWLITNQDCFKVSNSQIVVKDTEIFDNENPDVPQTNILVGMSFEELEALYPISDEELLLLRHKTKHRVLNVKNQHEHSGEEDKRPPNMSNLLNSESSDGDSSSASSTFRSPKLDQMSSVVDPTIDRNWIKLLYSNEDTITDTQLGKSAVTDLQRGQQVIPTLGAPNKSYQIPPLLQLDSNQGHGPIMLPNASYIPNRTNQFGDMSSNSLVQHQTELNSSLTHDISFRNQQHQPQQQLQFPMQPSNIRVPYQYHQHGNQQNTDLQATSTQTDDQQNTQSNHLIRESSNGFNGVHEFFSLIGAGGFNSIDEMFGSVEFFDKFYS